MNYMYYADPAGTPMARAHENCTAQNFTDFNLISCSTARSHYYYCTDLTLHRKGVCAGNLISEGQATCVDNAGGYNIDCTSTADIIASIGNNTCGDYIAEDKAWGYEMYMNEDGLYMPYRINFTFNSDVEGWGGVYGYDDENVVGGAIELYDSTGLSGYVNIPIGGDIYTRFVNDFSFDYRCQDGARFGFLMFFNDEVARYEENTCLQGTGRINCDDIAYTNENEVVGTFDSPIICDWTWRTAFVNLSRVAGDKRLYRLRLGDYDGYNLSNTGFLIQIDNFIMGRNYTIPGGEFTANCTSIPNVTSQDQNDVHYEICSGATCNDPTASCYVVATRNDTDCDPAVDSDTNMSVCRCFGSEGSDCKWWNRRLYIRRDHEVWHDCPEIRYQWIGFTIHNNTDYLRWCNESNVSVTYCSDISGEFSIRNKWFATDYDDSDWFDLYEVVLSWDYYHRYNDQYGEHNRWGCNYCSRFYRKEFQLEKNVAVGKTIVNCCSGSTLQNHHE